MKIKTRYKVVGWFVLFSFCLFVLVIFLTNYYIQNLLRGTNETNDFDLIDAIGYVVLASVLVLFSIFIFLVSITLISLVSYFISRTKANTELQKGFTYTTIGSFILLILFSIYWYST